MLDKNQLKLSGLKFGRLLQSAFRIANMFSVDHRTADAAVRQSYDALNELVKQTQQFTFGFFDHRVLVNNLLTPDKTLASLEAEFSKRGLGAVTFSSGMTLGRYRNALAVITASPETIEKAGGMRRWFSLNPVEGVRVIAARKGTTSSEEAEFAGDVESQFATQELGGGGSPGTTQLPFTLQLLLESAGLQEGDGGYTGAAGQVLELATRSIEATISNSERDPKQAVLTLARAMEEFKPEFLLSAMTPEQQRELRGRPSEEMAQQYMEDVAAQWAAVRLSSSAPEQRPIVEEEVVRVLSRSLEATKTIERMLSKLARLFDKANIPPEFYDRIRQELEWLGLTQETKYKRLREKQRYSNSEFRRLILFIKDELARGNAAVGAELAQHYFAILNLPPNELQPQELARAPELLKVITRLQTRQFMQRISALLGATLLDEQLRGWYHLHASVCLMTIAQGVALYEDFDLVQKIAADLDKSRARNAAQHAECCGAALANLLAPASIERAVELYTTSRELQRTFVTILKAMGAAGMEKVFQRLEEEKVASTRFTLLRLITQIGSSGAEVARQRLKHAKWYVVRNAINVLAEIKDPQFLADIAPTLRHEEDRVQQAAVSAIIKTRMPGRAKVLADGLTALKSHNADVALDEIRFVKDPASVPGLEAFLLCETSRVRELEKAVIALNAIKTEAATEALGRVLLESRVPMSIRKQVLRILGQSSLSAAHSALAEVASRAPHDPLAPECQKALEID
jgi:HEAT repeat protein